MTQSLSAARLGNVNPVRMLLYVEIFLTAEVNMICLLLAERTILPTIR
jgi:hypothetical protein